MPMKQSFKDIKAGDEITVNKSFTWGDMQWYVPAVYACEEGLVVDYCVEIDPEKINSFDFSSDLEVNGVKLKQESGYSTSWIPESCRPKGICNENERQQIFDQYQLDQSKGWVIFRHSYKWAGKQKPELKILQVHLEQRPVPITALKWKSPQKGAKILLTHPITGQEHVITVVDIEKQELGMLKQLNEAFEYPKHFTMMTYTVEPEFPQNLFHISDNMQGDSLRRKVPDAPDGAKAIGIIRRNKEAKLHTACSALHFEPVDEVEWRLVWQVKLWEDVLVGLIGLL